MGGTMSQLDILCYHVKHPVPEMEYTLMNYSPEESHRSSQTQQAIAKDTCYSLKPGSKTLLLKIPLTYYIEQGEVKMVPKQKLHLLVEVACSSPTTQTPNNYTETILIVTLLGQ